MSSELKQQLPADLFNPERLPARDNYGMCGHPDYDLIYNGLGIDDEGEAAHKFMTQDLGYEFCRISIEDDFDSDPNLEAQYDKDDGSCAYWTPSWPDGEGWLLTFIYIGEDGPEAWYSRLNQEVAA